MGAKSFPLFLDSLCAATSLSGGKIDDPRAKNDTRGSVGDYNLVFTDFPNKCWHLQVDVGTSHLRRGNSPKARSTLVLDSETFTSLFHRKMTLVTAQMTGKVRIEGDGHGIMFLSAFMSQMQQFKEQRGIQGLLSKKFFDFFLKECT